MTVQSNESNTVIACARDEASDADPLLPLFPPDAEELTGTAVSLYWHAELVQWQVCPIGSHHSVLL